MFIVHAAADVKGSKKNYILEFPYEPSFAELIARCESVFRSYRGEEFLVTNMQCYDDATGSWTPVQSMDDVFPECQLYVFEPNSWASDRQQQIPTATHPPLPPRTRPRTTRSKSGAILEPAGVLPSPGKADIMAAVLDAYDPLHNGTSQAAEAAAAAPPSRHAQPLGYDTITATSFPAAHIRGSSVVAPPLVDLSNTLPPPRLPSVVIPPAPPPSMPHSYTTVQANPPTNLVGLPAPALHPHHGNLLNIPSVPPRSLGHLPAHFQPPIHVAATPLVVTSMAHLHPDPHHPNPMTGEVFDFRAVYQDVSFQQKMHATFDHIAGNNSGAMTVDDWIKCSHDLQVPLPQAALITIFERADPLRRGRLGLNEWARLCEMYPALLESVYYRISAEEEAAAYQTKMYEAHVQLTVCANQERTLAEDLHAASVRVEGHAGDLGGVEVRLNTAVERLDRGQRILEEHRHHVGALMMEIDAQQGRMRMHVDRHNEVVHVVNEAVDESDAQVRLHQVAENAALAAENQLMALETQHSAMSSEAQAQTKALEDRINHARHAHDIKAAAEQHLEAAATETASLEAACTEIELHLTNLATSRSDFARASVHWEEMVEAAHVTLNRERDFYKELLQMEAACRSDVSTIKNQGVALEAALAQQLEEYETYCARRQMVEEQETPLVNEEIASRKRGLPLGTGEYGYRVPSHII
ncbi:calmodulin-like protein containing EF hand domain [Diplonema papillatum]|nr:calmodulin-like protein containing EF hand domain [Diplonema papillatum]